MSDERMVGAITNAIEMAQQELTIVNEKLKEFETTLERRKQLEAFVAQGKALLGLGSSGHLALASLDAAEGKSVTDRSVEILRECGRPMKPSEIALEFHKHGWKLSERNGGEIVRMALKRKSGLFVMVDKGAWDLKERHQ